MSASPESRWQRRSRPAVAAAPRFPLERRGGYLPADFVAFAYLTVVVVLVAIGRGSIPRWGLWMAVYLALLWGVTFLRFLPRQGRPVLQFFREAYGLCLLPFAYLSLATLNRIPSLRFYDDVVLRWDLAVFGTHPHQWLAARLPWPLVSEYLHFAYFVYALLVPTLGFTLAFQRRFEALRAFATTQMFTMYGCFLVYIFFPVRGPWHEFPHPPVSEHAVFPNLVHAMLNAGSSPGTAFPSSHVAGSTAVAIMAFRFSRRLSYLVGVLAVSIAIATVYGGFHYAIDSICGLAFGVTMALAGPRIHAWIWRRIRLHVIPLRFPYLRFRWRDGRIRGEVVRPVHGPRE